MRSYERPRYAISKARRKEKLWGRNGLKRRAIILLWAIREIVEISAKDLPRVRSTEIFIEISPDLDLPMNQNPVRNQAKLRSKRQPDLQYNVGVMEGHIILRTFLTRKALNIFRRFTRHIR